MMNRLLFLFVLICIVTAPLALAADKVELRQAQQVLAQMQAIRSAQTASHEALLSRSLGAEISLKLLRKIDSDNLSTFRYAMMFRGLPVWGEQVIVTEDPSQRVVRLHGNAITGIERDVTSIEAAFNAATALNLAKSLNCDKTGVREAYLYENETSELVIYVDNGTAKLCYAVTFFADIEAGGKPVRPTYILDATNKSVVFNFDGLTYDNGTGPGGNTKTGKYQYGVQYPAFQVAYANGTATMNTTNVKTVNLNHSTSGSTAYTYQGLENTFKEINGAYSPINDAHYFGGVVFGLYKDWYGTAPLTFQLTLRVHYSKSYENAFWNGSSMTFGDGATRFFPLVSLDVVTHEVSHGFTEQNSALIYSGQSGGINEAFSDIAGEASEYYMKNTNDWMVGADIFKSTGALRYFKNPPQDGRSIGSAKDYTNGMDVHYSSGVFNKAFYLLSSMNGWNTRKAFDVFVKANQKYWANSATFVSAAQGVVDAARDLGYSTADVATAFQGVDVVVNGY